MWWNSYVYFILSFPCCLLTFSSSIFPHWCELAPSWKLSRAIILLLSILLRVRNTWTLTHLKGGFSCVENRQSKVLGAVISTVRSISIYTMMQSLSFCLWTPPRWILNQTIKLWLKTVTFNCRGFAKCEWITVIFTHIPIFRGSKVIVHLTDSSFTASWGLFPHYFMTN